MLGLGTGPRCRNWLCVVVVCIGHGRASCVPVYLTFLWVRISEFFDVMIHQGLVASKNMLVKTED